jgi:predicted flap endonuclease-1-like 5' DNA nuclease/cell division protein FtsB
MFEQNITLGPGTGTFTQHTFEILIMLLGAFLLGLWLGWALWAKYKQQIDKLSLENQSLAVTTDALRSELSTIKGKLATIEYDNSNMSSQTESLTRNNANLRDRITTLESELSNALANNRQLNTELALTLEPDTPLADDFALEIIQQTQEQYPEIELLPLIEAAPVPVVEEPVFQPEADVIITPEIILTENSTAPFVLEPVAFPEPTPEKKKSSGKKSEVDKITADIVAAAASTADDLTVVEGIGPKIQMLLNQYGVYTYRQLAETEVERLKEILGAAGPQLAMHDPGTWPSQANLAANDQWDTLKSVQGFLKGGKKPN